MGEEGSGVAAEAEQPLLRIVRGNPKPDEVAALVAVVKNAALPFDAVLSAELARSYKPAPAVYRLAVEYLGFAPNEIMMVACHKYDLDAAQAFGMQAAFVARPFELGPDGHVDTTPELRFEVNAVDLLDLADKVGA